MKSILLIDDDSTLTSIYKNIFYNYKFDVTIASNIEEAKVYLKNTFDFIILDYYLGKEDSLDLLKEILKNYTVDKIILMSGINDKKIIQKLNKLKIKNIVTKPTNVKYLVEIINQNL